MLVPVLGLGLALAVALLVALLDVVAVALFLCPACQLEELEDRDVAETSIVLNEDGTITAGATNGPLPLSVRGKWSYDGNKYSMVSEQ